MIVHYNNPTRLEQVLDSVCSQVDETVVVDVSSSRSGPSLKSRPSMRIISTNNDGFGAGLRRGVAGTDAETILLMNHDALLAPQAVRALTHTLYSASNVGAVGPLLFEECTGRLTSAGGTINWRDCRIGHHLEPLGTEPYDVDWIDGAVTLVRRSAYEAIGGHDPRFFLYYEDADLCARLTAEGWRVMVDPGVLCKHTISGAFHEMVTLRERNVLLFTEKVGGRRLAAVRCVWAAGRIVAGALLRQPMAGARARGLLQYMGRRWGKLE